MPLPDVWTVNSEGIFESELLKPFSWLVHGFGTLLSPAWPGEYTQLKQIHSDVVFVADGKAGCLGEGDALITATPGQTIGIRTADCVPLLFADPNRHVVAAAHAGWRGTVAKIALHTVKRMQSDFGSDPRSLRAAIGPSIGRCCFEVGPEVSAQFLTYWPTVEDLTHVDLAAANFRQLLDAGMDRDHIDVAGLCTMCDPSHFHSFRRDRELAGRMVAAIGLKRIHK
jgi:YfiH family protein